MSRGRELSRRGAAGRRRAGRRLLARAARACAQEAQDAGEAGRAEAAGQPRDDAAARRLDPRRRRRQRHRLHRQGRARPGHQDRADPGRGRGAGRRAAAHRSSSPPTPRARRTRATPPAATRCRTAAPRSATPPRRCARSCWPRRRRALGVAGRPTRAARRRGRCAPDGRTRRLRRAGRAACRCTSQAQPDVAADRAGRAPGDRQAAAARRHPGQGHRRRRPTCRTCACPAWCTPASCARRATARGCRTSTSAAVERMPGVLKVVRDGSFLAVVAEREWQAIKAMRRSAGGRSWDEQPASRCRTGDMLDAICCACRPQDVHDPRQRGTRRRRRAQRVEATLPPALPDARRRSGRPAPWRLCEDGSVDGLDAHARASIRCARRSPSCCGLPPEKVRCIHVEGSGCYGHNGADDAAADAALLARAVPGRPVRVQWMREQEHGWEPFGPGDGDRGCARALDAERRDRRLAARGLEQHAHRPGPARPASLLAGLAPRPAVPAAAAQADPACPKAAATATPSRSTPSRRARVVHHFIPSHAAARLGAARRSAPT